MFGQRCESGTDAAYLVRGVLDEQPLAYRAAKQRLRLGPYFLPVSRETKAPLPAIRMSQMRIYLRERIMAASQPARGPTGAEYVYNCVNSTGLGIDSPDSKDEWRAEQALVQAGAGDCQWFAFNSRSGLYELRSHQLVETCSPFGCCDTGVPAAAVSPGNIPF